MPLPLSTKALSSLLVALVLLFSHMKAWNAGKNSVLDQHRDQAIQDAQDDAQATVEVVTEYIYREKEIEWDSATVRVRVEQLCDNRIQELQRARDSDDLAARLTFDAFVGEVQHCVSNTNQLEALQEYIRRRWN